MGTPQLCLNCGKPALPSIGTVPLCSGCHALVKDTRGVQFEKKKGAAPAPTG